MRNKAEFEPSKRPSYFEIAVWLWKLNLSNLSEGNLGELLERRNLPPEPVPNGQGGVNGSR